MRCIPLLIPKLMIFESKERKGIKPLLRGEHLFDFYDRMEGNAFDAYRERINLWASDLPVEAADIIARMRSRDDQNYDTALAELIIYQTFRRLSFCLTFHPEVIDENNHPDFLISNSSGEKTAYLEVTTINRPAYDVGRDNREGVVFGALNSIEIAADLRLVYSVEEFGAASPSAKKLCRAVMQWVEEHADAARAGQHITRDFQFHDWRIKLGLLGGASEKLDTSKIALWGSIAGKFVGQLEQLNSLKKSLNLKASRYGTLDLPYIIAVFDRTDTLAWFESDFAGNVAESLFGTEVHEDIMLTSGKVIGGGIRDIDGWFGCLETPKHSNVSAVIVFPEVSLWCFSKKRGQPIFVRNPWATHPITSDLLPIRHLIMTRTDWKLTAGQRMSEILGFPSPWPTPEDC